MSRISDNIPELNGSKKLPSREKKTAGHPKVDRAASMYDERAELLLKVFEGFMSHPDITAVSASAMTNTWALSHFAKAEQAS